MSAEFYYNVLSGLTSMFMIVCSLVAWNPKLFNNSTIRFFFRATVITLVSLSLISGHLGYDLHAVTCSDIVR